MNLIREVQYGQAFLFKYSTRPGTPAAERDQLPEDVKTERLHRLQALITEQQRTIQDSMVSREVSVLFERAGRFEGQIVGKSEYLHAVHVTTQRSNWGHPPRANHPKQSEFFGRPKPSIRTISGSAPHFTVCHKTTIPALQGTVSMCKTVSECVTFSPYFL